jgi:hypothetical protein
MTRTTRTGSNASPGCLMLFALPFAAVGVGMFVLVVWTYLECAAVKGWQEVPARIVRTKLEEHHDNDGGRTYQATAEYRYEFGGQPYTGKRVSLHGGSDNVGSFQKKVHRELAGYQKSGRPFRCYVNPAKPSEAVLYRDLRWEMIAFYGLFVLAFGGVGFGLLGAGLYARRKTRQEKARAEESPDEPWLWRDDWAKGEIRASGQRTWVIAAIVTVVWNAISLPALVLMPADALGTGPSWLVTGLAAVGFALLLVTGYLFLRWRKYHDSVFQMADVPGVIGGKLAGVIRTAATVRPDDGYRLTLYCIRRHTSGSGDNRTTTETILWQDQQTILHGLSEADFSQTAIPVLFGIPYDARPTEGSGDDLVFWRLEVTADVPGIDYKATFEVPVFKTAESRPDFQFDASLIAPYAAPVELDQELAAIGVSKTVAPDGSTRYVFPWARPLSAALGITAFTAIWTAAIAAMLHWHAPIFFPIVFGLFDLLLFYFLFDLWLYRSVVDVSARGLVIAGGRLWLSEAQSIEASQINAISLKEGMQAGRTVYYNLVVRLPNGKTLTAAKWLSNRRLADSLIRQWEAELTKPGA